MRLLNLLALSCGSLLLQLSVGNVETGFIERRQDTSISGSSSITSDLATTPVSTASSASGSNSPISTATSDSAKPTLPTGTDDSYLSSSSSPTFTVEPKTSSTSSSTHSRSITPSPTHTSATHGGNSTASASHNDSKDDQLPIKPKITPALSIGGAILIITGVAYALIGVKSRWVHVFLSSAYLASLSITVLVDYVMHPPVSNTIQGAYFVGIFMTGAIFGGGALIFKEVTEGLGCLLGGFCFSMWFLTLKSGGVITSASGKGIFIAAICVIAWAFSFSRYTRVYALIGSTSFSGSTALVLGIDCFSRAGLKEFWFYIWALNGDLFPLNTHNYPITKGIRVEIVVIVLICIIGIISQIKLWKVVRAKQQEKEAVRLDGERRKEVVEEAIGRHLQRHNDRDRSQWEMQYGDRLQSKRNTILWADTQPGKRASNISIIEVQPSSLSSSSDSLELNAFGPRVPSSVQGSKNKRQSAVTIDVIPEVEEDQEPRTSTERMKALTALEKDISRRSLRQSKSFAQPNSESYFSEKSPGAAQTDAIASVQEAQLERTSSPSKRRSLQSLLSRSPQPTPTDFPPSESQEALVLPVLSHSRASSVAATLDEENEELDRLALGIFDEDDVDTPKIVISSAASSENLNVQALKSKRPSTETLEAPPSPPALSVTPDFDPEELTRLDTLAGPVKEDAGEDQVMKKGEQQSRLKKSRNSTNSIAPSQTSSEKQSSADILTKGALDQVPSQLSNVVLSFRTNEWAKHISTAEAPVYDEPRNITGEDSELPTQLASATQNLSEESSDKLLPESTMQTLSTSSKPPPPHVVSVHSEVGAVANLSQPKRSLTDPNTADGQVKPPSRTASVQSLKDVAGRNTRNNTNAMLSKQSLVSTPIDEHTPTDFATQNIVRPNSTGYVYRVPSGMATSPSVGLSVLRPYTLQGASGNHMSRSNSYTSLVDSKRSRPLSQTSNVPAMRSETRLDSYESRQPSRRELTTEADRREILLAEWRMSQQQRAATNVLPKVDLDSRRAQMLSDREEKKMVEDQHRAAQRQKQQAIDQVMRRPDMQELHREALRKMQAKADQITEKPT